MKMLSPKERKMKLRLLEQLKREMNEDVDPLEEAAEPMAQVSVMADSPEELEEGLKTAQELLPTLEGVEMLEDADEEDDMSEEEEREMTKDEIEAEMERLQQLLNEMD